MEVKLIFILFSTFLANVDSGRILWFGPFVSKSMIITYKPLLMELAKKGHHITLVSANSMLNGKSDPQITEVIPNVDLDKVMENLSSSQLREGANPFSVLEMLNEVFKAVDECIGHPDMQSLIQDPTTKFDAVIVIPFFGNEAGYYFAKRFNSPLILYFTGQVSVSWIDEAVGQPHNTAYLPTAILPFTPEMNFFQRVINTFANFVFHKVLRNYYILGNDYRILNKHFPDEELPDLIELEKNASLVLSFGHPLIMDGWRPYAPNYINLGMMNCLGPRKLDPSDKLAQFLDQATEGVVFVSFGSVLRGSKMSEEKRIMFLNVFKKLKQKVIWKWETEEMDGKPDNVLLSKWLPQQEILAHPNTKLFVTHTGQSSFQETLCHQKPVVAIPVAGDQLANAVEASRMGIGVSIPFRNTNEENLLAGLQEVLSNPEYSKNAKRIGSALVNQIDRPLDRAVWWIEHVMKHPDMYAGRSPVHKLTWYQFLLLDVYAFYILLSLLVPLLFYKLFTFCCKKKSRKSKNE